MITVHFYPDVKARIRLCFHSDKDATLSTEKDFIFTQAVRIMQKRRYTAVQCQDLVRAPGIKEQQPSLNCSAGQSVYLPDKALVAGH